MTRARRARGPGSTLAALAALAVSAFTLLGCGSVSGSREEDVALNRAPIIGGEDSPPGQDATVYVYFDQLTCTGVVVAPTLVLTARNCLFDSANVQHPNDSQDRDLYIRCRPSETGEPVYQTLVPHDFTIAVGTWPEERLPKAKGLRFYVGDDLDLCTNDIALIEVDTPLSPAPLALRLDSAPRVGESGTVVGWGITSESQGRSPRVRQQRDLQVLAVGDSQFPIAGRQLSVNAGSFLTGEAGCLSDTGAPFISDESNAVVGILSYIEPVNLAVSVDAGAAYCSGGYSVFRSLQAQSQWIREAFARAQQEPWLEGNPPLAPVGQSCASAGDCASGVCKGVTNGVSFCSQSCDQDCPNGMQCLGAVGDRWCTPARVPDTDAASSGCAVGLAGVERRARGAWLVLTLLLIFAIRRPPRTRGQRSETTKERA